MLHYKETSMAKSPAKRENVVVWFEIPAVNFERAVAFYENIFSTKLKREAFGQNPMAVFPYQLESAISGCVMAGDGYAPGAQGTVIYLNADEDLNVPLARVKKAGGEVLLGKTALPPGMGFFAHLRDSEGNRVGLHSVA